MYCGGTFLFLVFWVLGVGGEKGVVEESHQSQDHVSSMKFWNGHRTIPLKLRLRQIWKWHQLPWTSMLNVKQKSDSAAVSLVPKIGSKRIQIRCTFRCWFRSWGLIVVSSPKNNGCSVCVFVCFVDLRHNTYNTHLEVTIFKSSKKNGLIWKVVNCKAQQSAQQSKASGW